MGRLKSLPKEAMSSIGVGMNNLVQTLHKKDLIRVISGNSCWMMFPKGSFTKYFGTLHDPRKIYIWFRVSTVFKNNWTLPVQKGAKTSPSPFGLMILTKFNFYKSLYKGSYLSCKLKLNIIYDNYVHVITWLTLSNDLGCLEINKIIYP